MAVNVIFSSLSDGEAISSSLDLGSGGVNDTEPDPVQFYVRHDGEQSIINCKLYVAPYSGSYTGTEDPQSDYDNIIGGGDNALTLLRPTGQLGYLQYSLDDGDTWTTIDSTNGAGLSTAISLGVIEADENLSIQFKFVFFDSISGLTDLGVRQIDLRLTYTYTN